MNPRLQAYLNDTGANGGASPKSRPDVRVIDIASLATATTSNQSFTAPRDGYFVIHQLNLSIPTADDLRDFTLHIRMAGQEITEKAVRADALFGDAKQPGMLPVPIIVPPNGQVDFEVTQDSGSTIANTQIVIIGEKIAID